MSIMHEKLRKGAGPSRTWYARLPDGSVYGPVDLPTLCQWAAESRIAPGHEVSPDGHNWQPAESLPTLKMEWFAHLPNGRTYGPFNVRAVPVLVEAGLLSADATLSHRRSGQEVHAERLLRDKRSVSCQNAGPGAAPFLSQQMTLPFEKLAVSPPRVASLPETTDTERQATRRRLPESESPSRRKGVEFKPTAAEREPAHCDEEELPARLSKAECHVQRATEEACAREAANLEKLREAASAREKAPGERETQRAGYETLSAETRASFAAEKVRLVSERDAAVARATDAERQLMALRQRLEAATRTAEFRARDLEHYISDLEAELRDRNEDLARSAEKVATAENRLAMLAAVEAAANRSAAREKDFLRRVEQLEQENEQLREKVPIGRPLLWTSAPGRTVRLLRVGSVLAAVVLATLGGFYLGFHRASPRPATSLSEAPSPFAGEVRTPSRATDLVPLPSGTREASAVSPARTLSDSVAPPLPVPPPIEAQALDFSSLEAPSRTPSRGSLPVLDIPGASIRPVGTSLRVVFDHGIFTSLTNFAPNAMDRLHTAARRIRPLLDSYGFIVEGHADSSPIIRAGPFSSNHELARARAEAAAAVLASALNVPAESIVAVGMAGQNPPFPEDTPTNRKKNRTVVLRLQPRKRPLPPVTPQVRR